MRIIWDWLVIIDVQITNCWEDRGLINCIVCTYKSSDGGSKNKNALGSHTKNVLHATVRV